MDTVLLKRMFKHMRENPQCLGFPTMFKPIKDVAVATMGARWDTFMLSVLLDAFNTSDERTLSETCSLPDVGVFPFSLFGEVELLCARRLAGAARQQESAIVREILVLYSRHACAGVSFYEKLLGSADAIRWDDADCLMVNKCLRVDPIILSVFVFRFGSAHKTCGIRREHGFNALPSAVRIPSSYAIYALTSGTTLE
jgi:hypothetical protein